MSRLLCITFQPPIKTPKSQSTFSLQPLSVHSPCDQPTQPSHIHRAERVLDNAGQRRAFPAMKVNPTIARRPRENRGPLGRLALLGREQRQQLQTERSSQTPFSTANGANHRNPHE